MVVMDVYVQLPGKAGLATPGTPGGNMRRGFSAASGVTAGSGSASERQGPNTPTNTLNREGTSSSLNGGPPGAGLLAVDLQQIVGAFTCDGDRPPPNLDCGLVQWEHFYHLHRSRVSSMFPASLNSFNEGSSNNSVSSASSKGSNSASSANQRSNYWTPPSSETGSVHVFPLPLPLLSHFIKIFFVYFLPLSRHLHVPVQYAQRPAVPVPHAGEPALEAAPGAHPAQEGQGVGRLACLNSCSFYCLG